MCTTSDFHKNVVTKLTHQKNLQSNLPILFTPEITQMKPSRTHIMHHKRIICVIESLSGRHILSPHRFPTQSVVVYLNTVAQNHIRTMLSSLWFFCIEYCSTEVETLELLVFAQEVLFLAGFCVDGEGYSFQISVAA